MKKKDPKLLIQIQTASEAFGVPVFVVDENKVIFNSNDKVFPNVLIKEFNNFFFSLKNKPEFFVKRLTSEEIYFAIHFDLDGKKYALLGGPCFNYLPTSEELFKNFSFSSDISFAHYESIKKYVTEYDLPKVVKILKFFYSLTTGQEISDEEIMMNSSEFLLDDSAVEDESTTLINKQNISENKTISYNEQITLLNMIKDGDIDTLSRMPQFVFDRVDHIVEKDKDNALYLSIAMVTLVSRAAIDGGVEIYYALSKSDHYIRRLDSTKNIQEINVIIKQMVYDYAYEVYRAKKKKKYSTTINRVINYINLNIHNHITLEDIADYVGLNHKYLSRYFIKEVGMKISTYIRKQRLNEAVTLLKYTNEDYSSIAYKLCFPSQSYFVEVFKKEYGLTPKAYRKAYSKMY